MLNGRCRKIERAYPVSPVTVVITVRLAVELVHHELVPAKKYQVVQQNAWPMRPVIVAEVAAQISLTSARR